MSTQNKTQSTAQFNQGSMGAFNQFTGSGSNALLSEINDPYSNMAFNTQLQMGNRALQQQQGMGNQALLQRMGASGINPSSPLYQSQLGMMQRQGMANQSGMYNNLLLNASQLRQQAIYQALGYKPLQTGMTNVQTQSGLGTWLPQVAGMAIKGGMAAATGGASLAAGGFGGGIGSAFLGASGSAPNQSFWQNNGSNGYANYDQTLQGPQ